MAEPVAEIAKVDKFRIAWPAEVGYEYQIQSSTDMQNWEDLGDPIIADKEEMAIFGAFFVVIGLMVCFLVLIFSVPALAAAYGVRKRAPWGRILGLVAAVLACMNLPLGTIVGVYTLITLIDKEVAEEFGMA